MYLSDASSALIQLTIYSYMQGGLNEIGIPSLVDFNSDNLFGAQYATSITDPNDEIRASSEEAFLASAMGRSNLKVFQLSMVKKILFDATNAPLESSSKRPASPMFCLHLARSSSLRAPSTLRRCSWSRASAPPQHFGR